MPRLFVHSSAEIRLERARSWLLQLPPSSPIVVLTATSESATELLHTTVVRMPARAVFGWRRATLARLATELAQPEMNRIGWAPATRLAAEAVVTRVIHGLALAAELGRYSDVAAKPGFARAVSAVVEELRLAGVGASQVAGVDPVLGAILDRYEESLRESGLADRAVVFEIASRWVREGASNDWLDQPTLLLDISVWTAAEQTLVAALAERSPQLLATCLAHDDQTIARLTNAGFTVETTPRTNATVAPAVARMQAELFGGTTPPPQEPSDEVTVLSAPGENRECVEIARKAQEFARSGIRFDHMAVLLRSAAEYRPHLEEAFDRAGIPVYFAKGTIRPDPAGRALVALLDCAAEGFSARRFAEYLSLGETPSLTKGGAPPQAVAAEERWVAADDEIVPELATEPDPVVPAKGASDATPDPLLAPRMWEQFLIDAAVIGGRDRWARRLDGLKADLALRLNSVEDQEGPEAARYRRQIDALTSLGNFALPLIDELAALPVQALWAEWLDRLGALATRALRHPENVLALMAELTPMAEVGPISLPEVRAVLSQRLLEVAAPPPRSCYGRLFIGPAENARGLAFDVVFIPGMAEKLFPKDVREEPIVLDEVRRRLAAGLITNDDRVSRERFALRLAVGAATRKLVLSYPRIDLEKGRPRVPSFYGLEAFRAAEGRLPDFAEFASRAEAASTTRVGWPAPESPDDAIDEAEHDLALLESLRGRDEAASQGVARYLLSANPHLGRALRFRGRRWLRSWKPADGLVEPNAAAAAALAAHRLDARSYSATALQHLSRCPYRFFLSAIQKLGPREMPEVIDQMDPLQRGLLLHQVQFRFLRRLAHKEMLPIPATRLAEIGAILDDVLDRAAGEHREELVPAIDRVWEDGIEDIRTDLREWLRRMSEDDSGFVPWRFEHAFGLQSRDGETTPPVALDCGMHLRGSIDLIERRSSGHLRVTDHKTGSVSFPDGAVTAGGTVLQPVLYALAAEKLFPDEVVTGGRLWHCTTAAGYEERVVPLNDAARSQAATVATALSKAIENGFFPAYPARDECAYCDFRPVCGPYEELRTQRKPVDHPALQPLIQLRGLV